MTNKKQIGIAMDHANAHLIEFSANPQETRKIESTYTHTSTDSGAGKNENNMHNKEKHGHADYYKRIGEAIRHYDEVLLFGPTDAKTELFNTLREDHLFEKIMIRVETTDKMTENQEHAYVKNYFTKHLAV